MSTLDLYERSLVLLSDAAEPNGWHEAALRLADELALPLRSYRVGTGPRADLVPEDAADWAERHGTGPGGAVLVRPDGFVAWRSPGPDPDAEDALRLVLRTGLAVG
jgi:putative polyketide hydroxylase